jgi:hypothetical protein
MQRAPVTVRLGMEQHWKGRSFPAARVIPANTSHSRESGNPAGRRRIPEVRGVDSRFRGNDVLMGDDAEMRSASIVEIAVCYSAVSPPRKRRPILPGMDCRFRRNDVLMGDDAEMGNASIAEIAVCYSGASPPRKRGSILPGMDCRFRGNDVLMGDDADMRSASIVEIAVCY